MVDEKIRSFIAIEINDADIKTCIMSFQKAMLSLNVDLKPVKTENIHLTLRFLGDITTTMIEKIAEELKTIRFPPFEIEFRDVGVFPNQNHIRIIWIGIRKGFTDLIDLNNQLTSKLINIGFPPETRKFKPHLTVARVRSSRNKSNLINMLQTMKNNIFGSLIVNSIKLKRSILTSNGPLYSTLFEVKGSKN
jgi:2'-5' RNA ligase